MKDLNLSNHMASADDPSLAMAKGQDPANGSEVRKKGEKYCEIDFSQDTFFGFMLEALTGRRRGAN